MNPPLAPSTRRLRHIDPLQRSKEMPCPYGATGRRIVPSFLVMSTIDREPSAPTTRPLRLGRRGLRECPPFIYAALGFVIGVIGAAQPRVAAVVVAHF